MSIFPNLSGRQGMSIFNRRRRPRQAVYASPQSQTTTLTTEVSDEHLADMVQDFDPGPRNNYNQFVSNNKSYTQYSSSSNTRPLQTRNLPAILKHPKNQENNRPNFEMNFPASSSLRGNNGMPSRQQQPMMETKPSWQTLHGNRFANKQPSSKEFRFEKNLVKQESQPRQNQCSWSNTNYYSPTKGDTAGVPAKQPSKDENASFGVLQNKYKKPKVEKEMNDVATTSSGVTMKMIDKSMRFITSTIQGLRRWSEHRDQIPLTFEIFATLDSVPTSNNNGTAKLFSIKDGTGMIRCIYWEMDQKLPRMARGQIYRLVGALERKTGHFQCFTIRQTQPDEQKSASGQATLSDDALTKVFSMIAEA